MYDEIVRRLRECASGECFNCSQFTETTNASVCSKELMKQAADAIEERCQQVDKFAEEAARLYAKLPRWIPVTERLPEQGKRYLVIRFDEVTKTQFIYILWHDAHDLWWNRLYKGQYNVTHWMPLPELPNEV